MFGRIAKHSDSVDSELLTKVRLSIQTSKLISPSKAVLNTVSGKIIQIISGFQNIYLTMIYALSSVHEKFDV